jgi:hypothetical protein
MLPRHLVDKDQRGILGKEPDRLVRCSQDTSLIKINAAYSARNQTVLCGKNAGLLKPKMDANSFSLLYVW